MSLPIRKSINVLLLNDDNKLLLMCADDPKTTSIDGTYHGRFWFPVGGKIEEGESIEQAALREIYEETGIKKEKIELGPVVWFGEFDLTLTGIPTRIKQTFIVAKTKQNNTSLDHLTPYEHKVVKKTVWFSLEEIKNCSDIIYPIVLPDYLPDILTDNYPEHPLEIDLAKQPKK